MLPFTADRIVAHVVLYAGEPIKVEALDAADNKIGQAISTDIHGVLQKLEVKVLDIMTLIFTGGGNEALLIGLCTYQEPHDKDEQAKGKNNNERRRV